MNLYEKHKAGLLASRFPSSSARVRSSVTRESTGQRTYHITDTEGRQVNFNPINAAVAVWSLSAIMRLNGDLQN